MYHENGRGGVMVEGFNRGVPVEIPYTPSMRDYFAAAAMQGFVIHYSGYTTCNFATDKNETASRAVAYVDALIKELDATGEK